MCEWGASPLPCGGDGRTGAAIAQRLGELDFSLESGQQELAVPEQGSGGRRWEAGGLCGSWEPGSKPFVAPQGSTRARPEKEKEKGGSSKFGSSLFLGVHWRGHLGITFWDCK